MSFFDQKLQFTYPKKRTSSTSKTVFSFVGRFCPPESGSGCGSRDPVESGSGATTLSKIMRIRMGNPDSRYFQYLPL